MRTGVWISADSTLDVIWVFKTRREAVKHTEAHPGFNTGFIPLGGLHK